MSNKAITIPAQPSFKVKYSLYMKIIDSIPEGKLSTLEAIDAFLSDVYGEPNIERPIPDASTRFYETLSGQTHIWWRGCSPRGLIQDWRIPIGMDKRKEKLETEGYTLICSYSSAPFFILPFVAQLKLRLMIEGYLLTRYSHYIWAILSFAYRRAVWIS